MRIIRTDTFFHKPVLEIEISPLAKSVSIAWFKDEGGSDAAFPLEHLLMPGFKTVKSDDPEILKFLAFCLGYGVGNLYVDRSMFEKAPWLAGDDLVSALAIEVVVEQSPPIALPLSKLLSKAPGVAIGTFIGYQIGAESPALMLISVPGGILAVSSAIGIAKALERGLHNKVEALFKSKSKRARAAD